jgi:hypothetical protein
VRIARPQLASVAFLAAVLAAVLAAAPARARPGGGASFKASGADSTPPSAASHATDPRPSHGQAPSERSTPQDDDHPRGISGIAERFVEDMPPPPQCAPPPPGAVARGSDWVLPDGSVLPRGAACSPEDQAAVEDYRAFAYSVLALLGELFLLAVASAHEGLRRRLYELAALALVAVPIHGGFNPWLSLLVWAVLPAFSYLTRPPRRPRDEPWAGR